MSIEIFLVHFVLGLSLGMVLFLVASGLSLIFGCMRLINFAHGLFYMLGAYLTVTVVSFLGGSITSFWWALLLAPIVAGIFGGICEISLIRRVYGQPLMAQVMITYGIVLIFTEVVRAIWGVQYKLVHMPELLSSSVPLGIIDLPLYYLFLVGFGGLVGVGLWFILERTQLGTMVRAIIADREMASILGIKVSLVFTSMFILGTWLAAIGGVLLAPMSGITPDMYMGMLINSFIIVIIGGLGSLRGSLVGALILGITMSMGVLIMPRFYVLIPSVLMIIVILARPQGLFGGGILAGEL